MVAEMMTEPFDGLPGVPTARCITRSIAPPPPRQACQLKNFVPVTERGPRGVRHWDLSRRSRTASQEVKTTSSGMARTRSACHRKSCRVTAYSSGYGRCGDWHGHGVVGYSSIPPRKLWQSFMLRTWLLEVSRSLKAAVNWGFFRNEPHSLKPRLDVMIVVFRRCRLCISVKN